MQTPGLGISSTRAMFTLEVVIPCWWKRVFKTNWARPPCLVFQVFICSLIKILGS